MKHLAKQAVFGLIVGGIMLPVFAAGVSHGFYAGIGASANTVDETFSSTFYSSTSKSAHDAYNVSSNRLSPMLQLGYSAPLQNQWLWGALLQWKYLNYQTANVNSSRGQYLPNPTFSSINFFGGDIHRDFTSRTRVNNEVLLLFYFGMDFMQGYTYIGIGPALLTASNHIYVSSVHTPNAVGDNLISTSVNSNKTMWGGAGQIGYNYYINPCVFFNINYTYLQTASTSFNNTVNADVLNGASVNGPVTLTLNRDIKVITQEVMLSINRVF